MWGALAPFPPPMANTSGLQWPMMAEADDDDDVPMQSTMVHLLPACR